MWLHALPFPAISSRPNRWPPPRRSRLTPGLVRTKSSHRLVRAAWARFISPATRASKRESRVQDSTFLSRRETRVQATFRAGGTGHLFAAAFQHLHPEAGIPAPLSARQVVSECGLGGAAIFRQAAMGFAVAWMWRAPGPRRPIRWMPHPLVQSQLEPVNPFYPATADGKRFLAHDLPLQNTSQLCYSIGALL
jgi:hypothetical protein